MDPTSAVRTETLPVIATVIGPGAVFSSPYAWVVLSQSPRLLEFLSTHEAIAVAATLVLWVTAGFMVESVGSYVEVYGIDRRRSDHDEMLATWWRYLRIAWRVEPIGQRYLRRLLVSLKFELNFGVATALSIPALGMLYRSGFVRREPAVWIAVLQIGIAACFYIAARGTAEVLADIRSNLVKGVGEPPFGTDDDRRRTHAA
jgi:hypothetical protein